MTATDDALAQLNLLLDEHAKLAGASDQAQRLTLILRLLAALDRLTAPTSTYAQAAARYRNNSEHSIPRLAGLAAVATALRDDIRAGWLSTVMELAHADTYQGYLEMAEGLYGQGYKDAAAVIAGTSLEVHLRSLGAKHGIGLQLPNRNSKKADTINAELKAIGVYNALEHKQVTAWLAIRNSAAHGNYSDYVETSVKGLIEGVRNFTVKYPA